MYSEKFTGVEDFQYQTFSKKVNKQNQDIEDIEQQSLVPTRISYFDAFFRFISSPRVCFILETAFFIFFLCLFSYFLMREMDFGQTPISEASTHEQFNSSAENSSSNPNNTNHSIKDFPEKNKYDKQINMPGIAEIILAFWVFTYFIQELVQV